MTPEQIYEEHADKELRTLVEAAVATSSSPGMVREAFQLAFADGHHKGRVADIDQLIEELK